MRFERFEEVWAATLAPTGPAGCVGLFWGPLLVEFDRIDHGRFVRLDVLDLPGVGDGRPEDAAAEAVIGRRALGEVWDELQMLADLGVAEVEMTDTPIWLARHDLATVARLSDDLHRLDGGDAPSRFALAAAELADVLHGLGELAPVDPAEVLERCRAVVLPPGRGPITWPGATVPVARELGRRLAGWVPGAYTRMVQEFENPFERDPVLVQQVAAPLVHLDTASGPEEVTEERDRVTWTEEDAGTVRRTRPSGTSTAWVWIDHDRVVTVESTLDGTEVPGWALLYSRPDTATDARTDRLVGGGPLSALDGWAFGRFGPTPARPTHVLFHDAPYGTPLSPLDEAFAALADGRAALDAEVTHPVTAARRWGDCAIRWLSLAEVGRAALAFDRCAAVPERDGSAFSAAAAGEHAWAFAPAWALPYLGGRSGNPHRPRWLDGERVAGG